jgi:hypothetical protein
MEETELINSLEKISSKIPNRILKLHGYIFKENYKEKLEIIIFKGFSSSTTHEIEIDLEKKVIEMDHIFTNFELYVAPLSTKFNNIIRENKDSLFFLNEENWI